MYAMFSNVYAFNVDIGRWDTSSVIDMEYMFVIDSAFNADISKWDVSSVTNMGGMFSGAAAFNADISRWDTSSVTDMYAMFSNVYAFNVDIGRWDTSSVIDMEFMFEGASAFNADISKWDVSSVSIMAVMFSGAAVFNADIGGWNTAKVTTMYAMFNGASAFNVDISGWDISLVTTMAYMFPGASAFDQSLCSWYSSTADMTDMFDGASKMAGLCTTSPSTTPPPNMTASVVPGCIVQFSPEALDSMACVKAPFDAANCQEARTWGQLYLAYERKGANPAFVTGGLGPLMTKDKFEVWVCLRGHPCLLEAGVNPAPADLMCFVYDEASRRFIPWDKQSSLNLF